MRIPAAAYNGFFRIAGGCRSGRNHLFVLLFRDIEQVEAVVRYRSDAVVSAPIASIISAEIFTGSS